MYIHVKVHPKAAKEDLVKKSDDHYEIWVKEKPERGMANMRVRELLAVSLGVGLDAVRIVSGHHSPSKLFSVKI